ncbi:MAG: hypothetical protein WCV69_01590 [Patescibacteria group bacterium]|jgi:hypothetical protein
MPDKQVQFEQPSQLLLFFNRFWIIITAILVGVLLLGGYYILIQQKIKSNDTLREGALQTSVDKDKSQQLLKNLETLKTTYEGIMSNRQADLERLKEIVPNNPQIAELFVLSDRLALEYGFQLLDISITDGEDKKKSSPQVVVSDEDGNTTTQVATTTKSKNIIALKTLVVAFKISPQATDGEVTMEEANGGQNKTYYESFKEFLDALEKNLRLTDIQTVNFASLQEDSKTPPQFQFSVQTYYR